MLLLKVIRSFCKEHCQKLQAAIVDGQKAQLKIKKHVGGMMNFMTVLARSRNFRRSGKRET